MTSGDAQQPSGGGERGTIAYVRPPSPSSLFTRRAERFAALAPGHTLAEYLEFLGHLAQAQRSACEAISAPAAFPARPEPLDSASRHPEPPRTEHGVVVPLEATTHRRGDAWRAALLAIVAELSTRALPGESRAALERLGGTSDVELEALAERVVANATVGADVAVGPFVAAALQVYFTTLAARVDPASVARVPSGCPVCGSLPVVGVVLADDRLRYLVCSLCATQWHHTRIQCTACRGAEHLSYHVVEGDRATRAPVASASKAEACGSCKAYTKLLYLDLDPRIEPFADDVGTLALDLLMAENGWARHGVNLFLLQADAEGDAR